MPLYRDSGVVLRTHKLGEADRIVTFLTREHGIVRAVAKGVRRTSSKFGSRLEPFMVVDLQLWTRNTSGRGLDIVNQAETIGSYGQHIAGDYPSYTAASAMVETAERLIPEESQPFPQLYILLVGALRSLSRHEHPASLMFDAFALRALAVAGWAPSFSDCARCGAAGPHRGFALTAGGSVCRDCRPPGSAAPSPETLELLGALLSGDWVAAESADPPSRREGSGLVSAYLQWHLERGVKSLRLIEREDPPVLASPPAGRTS